MATLNEVGLYASSVDEVGRDVNGAVDEIGVFVFTAVVTIPPAAPFYIVTSPMRW